MKLTVFLICIMMVLTGSTGPFRHDARTGNIHIVSGTFLGNEQRKLYGQGPVPDTLTVLWKYYTGTGTTVVYKDTVQWTGIGWTGQPVIYEKNSIPYIIIGAFDHKLRKLNALTGEEIWTYQFDDVIKGTPTLMEDFDSLIVLQGSRRGVDKAFTDPQIHSFRAISEQSGNEIWRFNIPLTDSYSRDIDGSALIFNDRIVLGAENGYLYVINPYETYSEGGYTFPSTEHALRLYDRSDITAHEWNLVTESSPSVHNKIVYVSSGSGHIYGINSVNWSIEMDFYTGADMDGSPVISNDGHIICSVEKQYINGYGGVMKLTPQGHVDWYYPTGNKSLSTWEGGVIGSAAIDESCEDISRHLCAFNAVDGYMYVVTLNAVETDSLVMAYDSSVFLNTPKLVYKKYIGGSISTPLILNDRIVTCGYDGKVRIFSIDYETMDIEEISSISLGGSIEATPVIYNGRIYIGCRDGFLYCLSSPQTQLIPDPQPGP